MNNMGIWVGGSIIILIFLIPISVFGQESPFYYFEEKPLYDNFVNGEQIELSVDKFTYKQGESLKIFGNLLISAKQFVYLDFFDDTGEKKFTIRYKKLQSYLDEIIEERKITRKNNK